MSSVNRKQLDVRISLPRSLSALESRVVKEVTKLFSRGHITGTITITSTQAKCGKIRVDEATASAYVDGLRRAAKKLGLKDDLSAKSLLGLPEVIVFERTVPSVGADWAVVRKALKQALEQLATMRQKEGTALHKDLTTRLRKLQARQESITKLAPGATSRYRKNLIRRLKDAGILSGPATPEITRELAIFADRSDITEEITRLRSHLSQADDLLASAKPAGRALDFLAQELLREINTIGAKANDSGVSKHVVTFKTELERIREQIQNVE